MYNKFGVNSQGLFNAKKNAKRLNCMRRKKNKKVSGKTTWIKNVKNSWQLYLLILPVVVYFFVVLFKL